MSEQSNVDTFIIKRLAELEVLSGGHTILLSTADVFELVRLAEIGERSIQDNMSETIHPRAPGNALQEAPGDSSDGFSDRSDNS